MGDFTPTTEQVRDGYAADPESEYRDPLSYSAVERAGRAAFDRWLAEHDAEVRRQALRPVGGPAMRATLEQLLYSLDSGNEVQKRALTPAIELLRAHEDDSRRRYGTDTEGAHDA